VSTRHTLTPYRDTCSARYGPTGPVPLTITSKLDLSAGSNHEKSKSKNSGFGSGFKSRKLPKLAA